MFGTLPSGVPAVRKLIDYLREVNSCPDMQVMCCGGIYKRAEGLAEEIGADLYAPDAAEAVEVANAQPDAARRPSISRPSAAPAGSARPPPAAKGRLPAPRRMSPQATPSSTETPKRRKPGASATPLANANHGRPAPTLGSWIDPGVGVFRGHLSAVGSFVIRRSFGLICFGDFLRRRGHRGKNVTPFRFRGPLFHPSVGSFVLAVRPHHHADAVGSFVAGKHWAPR